jgi:hypothetical protein
MFKYRPGQAPVLFVPRREVEIAENTFFVQYDIFDMPTTGDATIMVPLEVNKPYELHFLDPTFKRTVR